MINIATLRTSVITRLAAIPSGLPALIVAENDAFDPDPGVPHLVIGVRQLTHTQRSLANRNGHATATGRITATYYGVNDTGTDAFDACMAALTTYFATGTTLDAGNEFAVIGGNPGPYPGDITPYDAAFSYQLFTAPWYALVRTTIAA